jgi:hypothetical protein
MDVIWIVVHFDEYPFFFFVKSSPVQIYPSFVFFPLQEIHGIFFAKFINDGCGWIDLNFATAVFEITLQGDDGSDL